MYNMYITYKNHNKKLFPQMERAILYLQQRRGVFYLCKQLDF
jgi:hypothetical protein